MRTMGRTSGNRPPRPAAGGPGARTDRCRPRSDSLPCGGGGGGEGWLIPPPRRSVPLSQGAEGVGGLLPLAVAAPALPPGPHASPRPPGDGEGGGLGGSGSPLLSVVVSPLQVLHPQWGVHALPL